MTDTADLTLVDIALDDLHPADDNPRHQLGDLTELAASIASIGILQPLVVVEANVGGGFTIVAGHRRHAAARIAGVETVPCVVRTMDVAERQTAMLVENLHRQDLDPLDEATGFQHLADLGHSQRAIAELVGCNQSHVSRRLALTKLPDKAVEWVRTGKMQLRDAEELAALPEDDVDDVCTKVTDYESDAGLPSWAVREAINRVAGDRKHAAAIAAGEASGKKLAKSRPYDGAGDYRPCKKAEATHWFVDHRGSTVLWCRTAKADAKARAEAGEPAPTAKPDWQIRQEIADGAAIVRRAALADVYAGDPKAIVELGTEWLVEGVADGLRDIGFPSELVEQLTGDPLHLMAFSSLAQNCRPPTYSDEDAEDLAFWQVVLDRAAELSPAHAPGINEAPAIVECRECGCTDDLACEGGCSWVEPDLCSTCAPDLAEVDESEPPASEVVQKPEAPQVDGPDDADEFSLLDTPPIFAPKRPWATYDGNDVAFITKMATGMTVAAGVREILDYEIANGGRATIVDHCRKRIAELEA